MTCLVQIELARSKVERGWPSGSIRSGELQYPLIESAGFFERMDCEDKVIDVRDHGSEECRLAFLNRAIITPIGGM
jgi:hypothetical protein